MALKTNSKKALANLFEYILTDKDYLQERAEWDGIEIDFADPKSVATYIYQIYKQEKPDSDQVMYYCRIREQTEFEAWARGLALGGLFNYYYNVLATDIVARILEESEEEKSKYTESEAEDLLTKMIYMWVKKNLRKGGE